MLICFFLNSLLKFTVDLSVFISPNFLKDWGLLSYMISNSVLILLCGSLVFFILKKLNWQISTYLLLASILLLALITDIIPAPDYDLKSGKYLSVAGDWLKYYCNIQSILYFIFCLLAGVIYYKNKKADQIQFADYTTF